jgi:hypothetical protein
MDPVIVPFLFGMVAGAGFMAIIWRSVWEHEHGYINL